MAEGKSQTDLGIKDLVKIEYVGPNLYRACNLVQPKSYRACYGGQLASQALMAATKSVSDLDSDFLLHSVHCYFVGPAQASSELVYKVERIKDGKTFCSVAVKAIQKERVMFHCLASFQKNEDRLGVELDYNRHPMPAVPHPDDDEAKQASSSFQLVNHRGPLAMQSVTSTDRENVTDGENEDIVWQSNCSWVRAFDPFTADCHQNYHRISLTHLSDNWLADVARRHFSDLKTELITSLDHTVWFHAPLRADEWYLFVSECERFTGNRALSNRRVYNKDGNLVATVRQESLLRPKL